MRGVVCGDSCVNNSLLFIFMLLSCLDWWCILQAKTRVKLNFLENLAKFWELQVRAFSCTNCYIVHFVVMLFEGPDG